MTKLVKVGANIYRDNGIHLGWLEYDTQLDKQKFHVNEDYTEGIDEWELIQISKLLRN